MVIKRNEWLAESNMNLRSVAAATLLFVSLILVAVEAEPTAVPGHIIVARAEGAALIIWDATPEVASIVSDKLPDSDARTRLERDALNVVALEQFKLASPISVSVRVIYTKSGDVSPVYGSPTFAGVERYATLFMEASQVKNDKARWKEAAAGSGSLPAWVRFNVVGELPPR